MGTGKVCPGTGHQLQGFTADLNLELPSFVVPSRTYADLENATLNVGAIRESPLQLGLDI
ncbi:hypothetical protein [Oscillatoria sp. HE19RPO]|uniref:hypothetical protein n=1 Tax=Oscillatoria sp. HE19RPO TaxID=2954806 RepID=UPI0020C4F9C5|nr:hypothetical protein [Oscillatoria sp. HE19RPO]